MSAIPDSPRDRLIDSAINLFYDKSYTAVGVQEICTAAGLQKGSFYHFFPSKRDLALEALAEMQLRLIRYVFEPAYRTTVPAMERVRRQFDRAYRLQSGERDRSGSVKGSYLGNLGGELSTQDESVRSRIATLFDALAEWIETALKEAVNEGELPPSTNTRDSALAILAYFEGVLLLAKTNNDPSLIRRLAPCARQCIVLTE